MKTINFNSSGNPLKVKFVFNGLIAGSYSYTLYEKGEIDEEESIKKEGLDSDNTYNLPIPAALNNERIVKLFTSFKGLDPKNFPDYEIKVEVYQGENYLDSDSDKDVVTGEYRRSTIKVKLLAN